MKKIKPFEFTPLQLAWIEALEKGQLPDGTELKQGQSYLTQRERSETVEKDCCLGVACKVAMQLMPDLDLELEFVAQNSKPGPEDIITTEYDHEKGELPKKVGEALRVFESNGQPVTEKLPISLEEEYPYGEYESLVEMNDKRKLSFKEIAHVLKTYPWIFFKAPVRKRKVK